MTKEPRPKSKANVADDNEEDRPGDHRPTTASRANPPTTVTLPQWQHDWIDAQGKRLRSALIQKGLNYLAAGYPGSPFSDRAAWLAQNEDTDVLRRALAAKEALKGGT